jgi:hypothetical protein
MRRPQKEAEMPEPESSKTEEEPKEELGKKEVGEQIREKDPENIEEIAKAEGLPTDKQSSPPSPQPQTQVQPQPVRQLSEVEELEMYRAQMGERLLKEGTLHGLIAKLAKDEGKTYDTKLEELIAIFSETKEPKNKNISGEAIKIFDGITNRLVGMGFNVDTIMKILEKSQQKEPSDLDQLIQSLGKAQIAHFMQSSGKENLWERYATQALDNAVGGFSKGFYGYLGKRKAIRRTEEELE